MNILVIGELNADLILRNYSAFPSLGREVLVEDATLTLGSASAICAVGLARLGEQVRFLGKVGNDHWADLCLNWLAARGVDAGPVIRDATTQTGITVSITSARDRALVTYPGAMAALRAEEIDLRALTGCDHLHVSSFFLQPGLRPGLKRLLECARRQGLTVSLDPGFDPLENWGKDLIDCLTEVDVFLPNEVELEAISGHAEVGAALQSLANGRTLTVAKLGAAGCAVLKGGEVMRVPGFRVNPIDTTGAGDSFNAGFLHAWFKKTALEEALLFANACAALSTLSPGGIGGQPTESQAQELLMKGACR
ncbi:MAG TPA: carbohydrate kinase family protein [Bryobacteraceae bacterium]|nr:carbohydrate kinase family protein [Bryobacteraceae bacterium]